MSYEQQDFDPRSVLDVLVRHQVRFVVMGGTADLLRGADTPTLDVDITPATERPTSSG